FSTSGSVLTITSRHNDPSLYSAMDAEMLSQGIPQPRPNWLGGMLVNNVDVQSFTYGYFEAKLRWPNPGKGMFPAWWLYNARGGPKTNAEIDILEIFGDAGGKFSTSCHGSLSATLATETGDTTSWHTYGLDWQPSYLRFNKDRVQYFELTGPNAEWFD